MIDLKFLQKLLDLLNSSEADTIEIRKWTTTIKVSKNSGVGPVAYQVGPSSGLQTASSAASSGNAGEGETGDGGTAPKHLSEIKSPMVGTFYARPEPGAEPYVRDGGRITPGDTLCIIEAMKIMNQLDSEIAGVIVETLVEDAQPVEFGQVLFRVDTNG